MHQAKYFNRKPKINYHTLDKRGQVDGHTALVISVMRKNAYEYKFNFRQFHA